MSGVTALVLDQAPWWAVAAIAVIGALLGAVQAIFPQESQDRLKWWQSRWRHKERQIASRKAKELHSSPTGQ